MKIEIIKDIHDSCFNYEIEKLENKYYVSKGIIKFSTSFSKFKDAVDFIDKHYLSFKDFLETHNLKTAKGLQEEWERFAHLNKQALKIKAINEFLGE